LLDLLEILVTNIGELNNNNKNSQDQKKNNIVLTAICLSNLYNNNTNTEVVKKQNLYLDFGNSPNNTRIILIDIK
jgi:hypothetical protein